MEFRKATIEDIGQLTDNRMEFVTSIRDIPNPEQFRHATKQYLIEHIHDGSLIAYIGTDEGKIVSSCILCIYTTLPIPSALNGKCGLLLNVYTREPYRRQGLAKTLLGKLIDEARGRGVSKVTLAYTDDGYPLYESLGFVKCDRDMELKL